ncbi:hypothetical protein MMC26_002176 [Xylographa opegraphella]|nr:hypothetical protein [Xylographa opegraphella]
MSSKLHVGIVGSGIAGLYSALLLRRDGHRVTLYEADNRVGGRIYTHHFGSLSSKDDVYFEAGAMRIPRSSLHRNVYQLVRYLNTHGPSEDKVELIPYVLEHKNNRTFVRDHKLELDDPSLSSDLALPAEYSGKSAKKLLGEVLLAWLESLRKDFDAGFSQLLKYDEYSFRTYLRFVSGWPHEVIEFVELMASQTNQYDLSFTEIIMQNLDFDTKDWATVAGGMSRLTQSAANLIGRTNIHLNSPVTGILERPDCRITLTTSGPVIRSDTFDRVILAIPPGALHTMRERPTWSFMKEQALRGMHYEPLYKIGLHFRTRFWEQCTRPCFGGQSTTDLRFRWIVYPSNGLGAPGSGVLLLYSWMTDAARWQAIPHDERIRLALHDLQRFFTDDGIDVYEQYIEAFDVAWSCESATGDAMFLPGQFSRFHDVARRPEGNVYFAGEHLSRHHTWIAGAVESAMATVGQMLGREMIALGEEFATEAGRKDSKRTQISSRCLNYAIPQHNNLEYVREVCDG